ncbi:MAG: hypothetical protein GC200_08130 [Tepidisphaera sp.]|nr:hypothetical protein [Tepidisphaera sp.]
MSYQAARATLIDAAYDWQRREFFAGFDPAAPTVVLLPGGMGSQLDRTVGAYADGAALPFGEFETVWAGFGLIFGDEAASLAMNQAREDAGRRILVPNGPVRWKPFYTPYAATKTFIRDAGVNYFVFGYDWRRPVVENADYLEAFLRTLAAQADAMRGDQAGLGDLTLLAHSQGGLVGSVFLARFRAKAGENLDRYVRRFISVGSPFYGTCGHVHRYFVGDSLLNWRLGRTTLAKYIASMPGPYALCHLDFESYHSLCATTEFANDLPEYPTRDAASGGPADIHDPAMFERLPSWMRGEWAVAVREALDDARDVAWLLAEGLPREAQSRVFHIRGGITPSVTNLVWGEWPNASRTEAKSEVSPLSPGLAAEQGKQGDGVVPYWSSRLAQTPLSRVYDLRQATDHMDFMEHPEVLSVVKHVMEHDAVPAPAEAASRAMLIEAQPQERASEEAAREFLQQAAAGEIGPADPQDPAVWKRVLESFSVC